MQVLMKKDHQNRLFVEDIPVPPVLPGQVKIEIKYAGICGTDMHILLNEYKHDVPVVLGHEYAGEIVEVGEGVNRFAVGDPVVSLTTAGTCGSCEYCIAGIRMLCKNRRSMGTHVQGAFAKYLVIDQGLVYKIPEGVSYEEASLTEPLACGVHAIMEMTHIIAGDVVLISGPGTIGLLAMQIAKACGGVAVVTGTDGDEERLALARELGADHTVNVSRDDPEPLVQKISGGYGADVAVECAGVEASAKSCLALMRGRGRYHQLGLYGKPINFDFDGLVFKEITVTTSYATTYTSFKRALQLMALKLVRTSPLISAKLPFSQWEKGFEMFKNKEGFRVLLYPE